MNYLIVHEAHPTIPAGQFIRTDPESPSPEEIDPDTVVIVYISSGNVDTEIPFIIGLNVVDARAAIAQASLALGTVTALLDLDDVYIVLDQDPLGGEAATVGDTVSITVGVGGFVGVGSHYGSARRH